jgi:hypothetical protein
LQLSLIVHVGFVHLAFFYLFLQCILVLVRKDAISIFIVYPMLQVDLVLEVFAEGARILHLAYVKFADFGSFANLFALRLLRLSCSAILLVAFKGIEVVA